MRQSEDPRDQLMAQIQDRLVSLEDMLPRNDGIVSVRMADAEAMSIFSAIKKGNYIDAIKIYRRRTNSGLKEARDFVEAIRNGQKITAVKIYMNSAGVGIADAKSFVDQVIQI